MKIYNEVVLQWNDLTGQFDTMYEDSEEYNGPMAFMQGGLPPNASSINTSDTIADTIKTTAGYFSGGDGTLSGQDIYTSSLSASNDQYYYNINQAPPTSASAATQFSVSFGHADGSGSDTYGDSTTNNATLRGETETIYRQFANLLMDETEASGGFKIAQGNSAKPGWVSTGERDQYIYILVGKRERFKDRINKKAWTLTLSGSDSASKGLAKLSLTDDSAYVAAAATPGGPRHNIVSGALGIPTGSSPAVAYAHKTIGWFYPEMGVMLFSGPMLSASIPGDTTTAAHVGASASKFVGSDLFTAAKNAVRVSSSGFTPNTASNVIDPLGNALKLATCMQLSGQTSTVFRLRSEEDQTQENYFCRIRAEQYNFSANPSFTSGSKNKIRNTDMHGNPQTFITGIGLYNSAGQLLAIAKLSSPLKKNFASEATIKVKLTY